MNKDTNKTPQINYKDKDNKIAKWRLDRGEIITLKFIATEKVKTND